MLISELRWTKRRLVGAAVLCIVLIAGLAILWQMGHVAEAAILDPHPGLVGWWRFDEGDESVAEDSSGFGNHGTVYGATLVDGKHGKALSFDGTDDYVDLGLPASLRTRSAITIMAWVNEQTREREDLVVNREGTYRLAINLQKVQARFATDDVGWSVGYLQGKTIVSLNEWHHIAVTYDGAKLRVYLDGEEDGSKDITGLIVDGIRNVYIGGDSIYAAGDARYFGGVIDEVRIYDRALSAAEIQGIFQRGPNLPTRLLAKVPKGTTQFIATLTWQGLGSINTTIESPSKNYTEDMVLIYERTVYSSSGSISNMLNVKRLAVSVTVLPSDENWYIVLEFDNVEDFRITVEVQR